MANLNLTLKLLFIFICVSTSSLYFLAKQEHLNYILNKIGYVHESQINTKNNNDRFNLTEKIQFNNKSYDFNIFLIETNDSRSFLTFKQVLAIESAAKHNPNALVNVCTLRAKFDNFSINLLNTYQNINLTRVRPIHVLKDTPLEQWWLDDRLTYQNYYFAYAHLSDALRLALLYKHSGVYIDLDTITLRSFEKLYKYSGFASELQGDEVDSGNAFIIQNKKNSSFLWYVMEKFSEEYEPNKFADNGPFLIKAALQTHCKTSSLNQLLLAPNILPIKENERITFKPTQSVCDYHIFPFYVAYPYYVYSTGSLYDHNSTIDISKFLHSYLVHFNSFTNGRANGQITFNERSTYEFFAAFNCPLTYDLLKNGFYEIA